MGVTEIERTIGEQLCPNCGSANLVVATDPPYRVEPTKSNPSPKVWWTGYDCKDCGEKLRFAK